MSGLQIADLVLHNQISQKMLPYYAKKHQTV